MKTARRLSVLTAAAALLFGSGPAANAETIVRKSISYFQIGGTTAEDLDRELERRDRKPAPADRVIRAPRRSSSAET